MRAMVIPRFGDPDVFEERHVETPIPGAGEVLVRVIASGTNPVDAKIRANGTWAGIVPPAILGYDAAGVIEQAGAGVSDFAAGDEVYYTPMIHGNQMGTYAEYEVVPASIVAPKPKNLSFVEAAAVPLAGGTAYEAIVRRLRLHVGQRILIHGGAGGVGSFAVQIAKAAGAFVLATASATHQATLTALGADVAIDYQRERPSEAVQRATGGDGVDAVFDTVGDRLIADSIEVVRPFGHLATILDPEGDLRGFTFANLTLHGIFLTRERERLEELTRLIERGQVRPLVDEVLPLEQVRKAHERLDSGHGKGKIVLRVAT
ncbi:MAG TPA: zinc-dependent alcohol dehydrogenase family protein [Gemmatimonadaceae bacterium]